MVRANCPWSQKTCSGGPDLLTFYWRTPRNPRTSQKEHRVLVYYQGVVVTSTVTVSKQQRSRTNTQKNVFSRIGVRLLNQIPNQ